MVALDHQRIEPVRRQRPPRAAQAVAQPQPVPLIPAGRFHAHHHLRLRRPGQHRGHARLHLVVAGPGVVKPAPAAQLTPASFIATKSAYPLLTSMPRYTVVIAPTPGWIHRGFSRPSKSASSLVDPRSQRRILPRIDRSRREEQSPCRGHASWHTPFSSAARSVYTRFDTFNIPGTEDTEESFHLSLIKFHLSFVIEERASGNREIVSIG